MSNEIKKASHFYELRCLREIKEQAERLGSFPETSGEELITVQLMNTNHLLAIIADKLTLIANNMEK